MIRSITPHARRQITGERVSDTRDSGVDKHTYMEIDMRAP
ncbi:hypothetical protein HmCmsJML034_00972 [Escherichia coli]|nr:hypothetical protein HmCmsJML034_00972 [Escherichia coli]